MQQLSFFEFQAAKKVMSPADYSKQFSALVDDSGEIVDFLLVYPGGLFIEFLKTGEFYTMIGREEFICREADKLERVLYAFGCDIYFVCKDTL